MEATQIRQMQRIFVDLFYGFKDWTGLKLCLTIGRQKTIPIEQADHEKFARQRPDFRGKHGRTIY
jgi:hypothetical protein